MQGLLQKAGFTAEGRVYCRKMRAAGKYVLQDNVWADLPQVGWSKVALNDPLLQVVTLFVYLAAKGSWCT
jgi:hypothetical protein